MLQPIEATPASRAPRFAASIIPGPTPVMIPKPASPSSRAVVTHRSYRASSCVTRADPNTDTHGPAPASASKPSTNSPMMRKTRQASLLSAKDGSPRKSSSALSRKRSSSVPPAGTGGSRSGIPEITRAKGRVSRSRWPGGSNDSGTASCTCSALRPRPATPSSASRFSSFITLSSPALARFVATRSSAREPRRARTRASNPSRCGGVSSCTGSHQARASQDARGTDPPHPGS